MINLKERSIGTLILVSIIGIVAGYYLTTTLCALIPGDGNVVKTFFTTNFISLGLGFPNAVYLDLGAIKFQIGFQMKFNAFSIIGIFISLYCFRWFK